MGECYIEKFKIVIAQKKKNRDIHQQFMRKGLGTLTHKM